MRAVVYCRCRYFVLEKTRWPIIVCYRCAELYWISRNRLGKKKINKSFIQTRGMHVIPDGFRIIFDFSHDIHRHSVDILNARVYENSTNRMKKKNYLRAYVTLSLQFRKCIRDFFFFIITLRQSFFLFFR